MHTYLYMYYYGLFMYICPSLTPTKGVVMEKVVTVRARGYIYIYIYIRIAMGRTSSRIGQCEREYIHMFMSSICIYTYTHIFVHCLLIEHPQMRVLVILVSAHVHAKSAIQSTTETLIHR
jgi:hypothetical protein